MNGADKEPDGRYSGRGMNATNMADASDAASTYSTTQRQHCAKPRLSDKPDEETAGLIEKLRALLGQPEPVLAPAA